MLTNLESAPFTLCKALITGQYSGNLKNFGTNCESYIYIQVKVFTCMLTGNESLLDFVSDICHRFKAFSCNALHNGGDDTEILDKTLSSSVLRFQTIEDFGKPEKSVKLTS